MQIQSKSPFKRNLYTAQYKPLFTPISSNRNHLKTRQIKTSKTPRGLPILGHANSLQNLRQNLSYEQYLLKVNSASKVDEKSIVSSYLNNLRKDYDKIAQNTKLRQRQINCMKKQIDLMKKRRNQQSGHKSELINFLNNKQVNISEIQLKHDLIKMQTKVLFHTIQRMKKDQIIYKTNLRTYEQDFNSKQRVFKEKNEELINWEETLYKIMSTMNEYKRYYEKNKDKREDKYENFCEKIEALQDKEKFILQREQRTYQLLSIQSNDLLDSKNIVLRQVLMTNKIADQILQHKISSLLKKYYHTQNAFHTIKSKTSINDPNLLANKFFSYGELTQNLMKTISHNQIELDKVTKKNQQLNSIYKELLNKNYQECLSREDENSDMKEQKTKIVKETIQSKLLLDKLSSWINSRFSLLKCKQLTKQDTLSIKFKSLCSILKDQVQKIQNTKDNALHKAYQANGIRIKKVVKQLSIEQQSIRKSEAIQMKDSNRIQKQFLAQSRLILKKSYAPKSKMTDLK